MDGDRMNEPRYVNPAGVAAPGGHYSHATVANGFVFVAGQLPIRADGVKLADASFEDQARQVLANVQAILEGCGSGVYVDDIADWPKFNAVYNEWAGAAKPARAVVPTAALHYGFKVEVEAVALA
jgi:2-iminobutanoate/2-iminopropanoate deaminase